VPDARAALWLIRHAPTPDNHDGVIMGQRDPEPTHTGLREAAALCAAGGPLEDVSFAQAVSSDARRAVKTATAIAPRAALRLDERLRERHLGDWEGQDKRIVCAEHPGAFTDGGAVRLDAVLPGAESLDDLMRRVHAAISELADAPRPLLVVAHNGSLRVAMVLLGLTDFATASAASLPHLSPIAADLGRLREPGSVV
jgi:broad specificity phosphatase PhoE